MGVGMAVFDSTGYTEAGIPYERPGRATVVLVAAFDFLGVLIAGLVVLGAAYSLELEDGSARSPELLAMQPLEQPKSPEEWAARRAERRERFSTLKIAKLVGAALVTIGAFGFYLVQL
jgi:hypothetical protein